MKYYAIPNNSLTSSIKELVQTCELKEKELSDNTFFDEPASEKDVILWEQSNHIIIPTPYKEWLQFASYCQIDQNLAEFYSVDMFEVINSNGDNYVHIGNLIGDGEQLCFGILDGLFYKILDGCISNPIFDFAEILKEVERMLSDDCILSDAAKRQLLENDITTYDKFVIAQKINALSIPERKAILSSLTRNEYTYFTNDMRRQVVRCFWNNERELIKNGQCTRDWTPEQIEGIFNIDTSNGMMKKNAGVAMELDGRGPKLNSKGKMIFYIGRHLVNVIIHPEYVAEPRNMQALDTKEYKEAIEKGTQE